MFSPNLVFEHTRVGLLATLELNFSNCSDPDVREVEEAEEEIAEMVTSARHKEMLQLVTENPV
jgi:hypothetical protein